MKEEDKRQNKRLIVYIAECSFINNTQYLNVFCYKKIQCRYIILVMCFMFRTKYRIEQNILRDRVGIAQWLVCSPLTQ